MCFLDFKLIGNPAPPLARSVYRTKSTQNGLSTRVRDTECIFRCPFFGYYAELHLVFIKFSSVKIVNYRRKRKSFANAPRGGKKSCENGGCRKSG